MSKEEKRIEKEKKRREKFADERDSILSVRNYKVARGTVIVDNFYKEEEINRMIEKASSFIKESRRLHKLIEREEKRKGVNQEKPYQESEKIKVSEIGTSSSKTFQIKRKNWESNERFETRKTLILDKVKTKGKKRIEREELMRISNQFFSGFESKVCCTDE